MCRPFDRNCRADGAERLPVATKRSCPRSAPSAPLPDLHGTAGSSRSSSTPTPHHRQGVLAPADIGIGAVSWPSSPPPAPPSSSARCCVRVCWNACWPRGPCSTLTRRCTSSSIPRAGRAGAAPKPSFSCRECSGRSPTTACARPRGTGRRGRLRTPLRRGGPGPRPSCSLVRPRSASAGDRRDLPRQRPRPRRPRGAP